MRPHKAIGLVTLAYCILIFLYAVLVPPWETPDEPAHYRYAAQLAARWRPPADPGVRQKDRFCRDYDFISSNYEWYHPALGYAPAAICYKIVKLLAPRSLPAEIPPLNPQFCNDPFNHPLLFSHETLVPISVWEGLWGVLIVRIFSSVGGLIVIFAAYQIGRHLRMGDLAPIAAAWIAFLPQFIFISASVRNDTLANAIGALLFLLIALMQIAPERCKRYSLITGGLLGMGLLTKLTLAYLYPAAFLAIILSARWKPRRWIRPVMYMLISGSAVTILYYAAYEEARSALIYTINQMKINPELFSWFYIRRIPAMLVDLFFARFGWANIVVPSLWIRAALVMWIIGVLLSVSRGILVRKEEPTTVRILFILAFGFLLAIAGVFRYNLSHFQPQGRFLFPVLVCWALLGTWGFSRLSNRRVSRIIGISTVVFMFLFNLRALILLWATYY